MDFVFCVLSDNVLYVYRVSQKYLQAFQNYGADMILYKYLKRGIIT